MDESIEVELTCDCHKNLGLFLMPKDIGYKIWTSAELTYVGMQRFCSLLLTVTLQPLDSNIYNIL